MFFFRYNNGDKLLTARKLLQLGISDRQAADLLNTYMVEFGIITATDRAHIIDRGTIRRWKAKIYEEKIPSNLNSVYFDGKIDSTRQPNGSFKNEDHFTIISEPQTEFIAHVKPTGKSTSENVSKAIIDKIKECDSFDNVKVNRININLLLQIKLTINYIIFQIYKLI